MALKKQIFIVTESPSMSVIRWKRGRRDGDNERTGLNVGGEEEVAKAGVELVCRGAGVNCDMETRRGLGQEPWRGGLF